MCMHTAYVHMCGHVCGSQELTLCDFLFNSPSCYCFGEKGSTLPYSFRGDFCHGEEDITVGAYTLFTF